MEQRETFTLTFELQRQVIGTGVCGREWVHEQQAAPAPLALFCPMCGEIWGRIRVLPQLEPWAMEPRRCQQHGDGDFADFRWASKAIRTSESNMLLRYVFQIEHTRHILTPHLYSRLELVNP